MKKGQVATGMMLFFAIITITLIIVVFFALVEINSIGVGKELKKSAKTVDDHLMLLNYLRTEVVVEGRNMNVADLINLYLMDKSSYGDGLMKVSKEILDPFYTGKIYWKIVMDEEYIRQNDKCDDDLTEVEARIPDFDVSKGAHIIKLVNCED